MTVASLILPQQLDLRAKLALLVALLCYPKPSPWASWAKKWLKGETGNTNYAFTLAIGEKVSGFIPFTSMEYLAANAATLVIFYYEQIANADYQESQVKFADLLADQLRLVVKYTQAAGIERAEIQLLIAQQGQEAKDEPM